MIARINKSKILTKYTSRKCKCKCDAKNVTEIRSGIWINGSVGAKIQKNMSVKKIVPGILLHELVKMINI